MMIPLTRDSTLSDLKYILLGLLLVSACTHRSEIASIEPTAEVKKTKHSLKANKRSSEVWEVYRNRGLSTTLPPNHSPEEQVPDVVSVHNIRPVGGIPSVKACRVLIESLAARNEPSPNALIIRRYKKGSVLNFYESEGVWLRIDSYLYIPKMYCRDVAIK